MALQCHLHVVVYIEERYNSMTLFQRTDLPTPLKVHLAASALSGKGKYGEMTDLAFRFGVSRETVNQAADCAERILTGYFEADRSTPKFPDVKVDNTQLERTIIALRVVAPNSIRQIEALLPLIYPGTKLSYGKIQGILANAEQAAAKYNKQVDLSGIHAVALDEMYSQGSPVLAGVDLDSGYLFALALRESRSADDWKEVLSPGKEQGLQMEIAVKDAAPGIAQGVREVFPDAQQRDDSFHAIYLMGKHRSRLERKAYGQLTKLEENMAQIRKSRIRGNKGRAKRQKLLVQQGWIIKRCDAAMELHDRFERAVRQAREAMELVDLERGELRDPCWMRAQIEDAANQMLAIEDEDCRKIAKYIHNRAPGLSLYAEQLRNELLQIADHYHEDEVVLGAIIWRLVDDLRNHRRPWERFQSKRHLAEAYGLLLNLAGAQTDKILQVVDGIFMHRHRASSAIEGFNAFLRPYLYVHKGVTQGFLELLRAYYNLRIRKWGRHKGTSAAECLTGERIDDWLDEFRPCYAVPA